MCYVCVFGLRRQAWRAPKCIEIMCAKCSFFESRGNDNKGEREMIVRRDCRNAGAN